MVKSEKESEKCDTKQRQQENIRHNVCRHIHLLFTVSPWRMCFNLQSATTICDQIYS